MTPWRRCTSRARGGVGQFAFEVLIELIVGCDGFGYNVSRLASIAHDCVEIFRDRNKLHFSRAVAVHTQWGFKRAGFFSRRRIVHQYFSVLAHNNENFSAWFRHRRLPFLVCTFSLHTSLTAVLCVPRYFTFFEWGVNTARFLLRTFDYAWFLCIISAWQKIIRHHQMGRRIRLHNKKQRGRAARKSQQVSLRTWAQLFWLS